jgi:hypothetical protein
MDNWIEIDGVSYPELIDYVVGEVIGVCGCADMDGICDYMDKVFNHFNTAQERGVYWDTLVDEVFKGNETFAYLLVGRMDHAELLEHGISMRGSWLTDKGRELWVDVKKCLEIIKQENDEPTKD